MKARLTGLSVFLLTGCSNIQYVPDGAFVYTAAEHAALRASFSAMVEEVAFARSYRQLVDKAQCATFVY